MTEQLTLTYNDQFQDQQAWAVVSAEIERVLAHVGRKEFCYSMETTESRLSNALAGRDRYPFHAQWLVYLIRKDPTTGLIAALAGPARCDVERRQPLTDAQKLARYESAIDRLPESLREAIKRDAGLL
jgi:hypothetical protein